MKVTTSKQEPEFQPRSITITFESQAELDAVGCMLIYSPLCRAAAKTFGIQRPEIWKDLQAIGANTSARWMQFSSEIK